MLVAETEPKRLFFGMEVVAPWPESLPKGRVLSVGDRHLTLAFLGDSALPRFMQQFPRPAFRLGIAALFDRPVFLPERSPRTAGWHLQFLEHEDQLLDFQRRIVNWLTDLGLQLRTRERLIRRRLFRSPLGQS